MSKSKIFLYILLSFMGGVLVRSFVPVTLVLIWILALIGYALLVVFRKFKKMILAGFLILFFTLGIWRMDLALSSAPDLSSFWSNSGVWKGVVWEEPDIKELVARFKIKILQVDDRVINKPFWVLVTDRKYPSYDLGDELEIKGILKQPQNYGEFDYVSYLARQGISAVIDFPEIDKIGERKVGIIRGYLDDIKISFENNINRVLPEPHAAFLKGLLLGEKSSLPDGLLADFKIAGVSHVVALSGYNITLVGRFIMSALAVFMIPFFVSFWIAVLGLVLFVVMVGSSASVVRAAIMGILVLVAQREGRLYHITNALALAGALMIWQNPSILRFDVAFQLSFLATIGLVYVSPQVEDVFAKLANFLKGKPGISRAMLKNSQEDSSSFQKILTETISAQFMVLPLLIYNFGQVSLISPLSNMLVLMAVPWSMALGFVAGLAGFFSLVLSRVAGWAVWFVLEYKLVVIELLADVPNAAVPLSGWFLIPVLLGYFWILYRLARNKRTNESQP